jgi:hypothetical protein
VEGERAPLVLMICAMQDCNKARYYILWWPPELQIADYFPENQISPGYRYIERNTNIAILQIRNGYL